MAQRHWVGAYPGTWDATVGTKWSTTQGGAGGSAVPTAVDDVFFHGDAGSANNTIVIAGAMVCKSLNFTDWNGFFGSTTGTATLTVSGNITLSQYMTIPNYQITAPFAVWTLTINAASVITSKGVAINAPIIINAPAAAVSLADEFVDASDTLTITAATFSDGGFVHSAKGLASSNANVRTVGLTGTWTIGSNGIDLTTVTNLTFNALTSTTKLGDACTITMSNKNFGAVIITDAITVLFAGAGTFQSLVCLLTAQLIFTSGLVYTVGAQSFRGVSVASQLVIRGSVAGTPATLVQAPGGFFEYCFIKDIDAGLPSVARRSTNVSGNANITFTESNAQSMLMAA